VSWCRTSEWGVAGDRNRWVSVIGMAQPVEVALMLRLLGVETPPCHHRRPRRPVTI
jgi:hypothetical protein